MRVIALDGRGWATFDDLFDALLPALDAPDWHGRSYNALLDSMGTGAVNAVEPRYRIEITGASQMATEVLDFLCDLRGDIERRLREEVADGRPPRDIEIVLDGDV